MDTKLKAQMIKIQNQLKYVCYVQKTFILNAADGTFLAIGDDGPNDAHSRVA